MQWFKLCSQAEDAELKVALQPNMCQPLSTIPRAYTSKSGVIILKLSLITLRFMGLDLRLHK